MTLLTAIKSMQAAGVEVSLRITQLSGAGWHSDRPHLAAEDADRYVADPVGFLAEHYGVTRDVYLAWAESGGNVYCQAITRSKRRCRCTLPGKVRIDRPDTWWRSEQEGGYCSLHDGER